MLEQYFGTNTNAGVLCLEDFPDHIDWYNQQGGNKNGIFIELRNVSRVRVAFSVRLSYESGRLCPLQTQDGKPLLELQFTNGGEALEPNQQMQARCRINELTSQHQKQRFLIEIIALGGAAAGAPPKGAVLFRSKPIDVRSRHKDVKGGKAKRDGEAAAMAAPPFSPTTLSPPLHRARSLDIDMRSLPASRSPPSSSPTFGAPGGRSAFGGHRHGHHTRAFATSPPNGNSASAEVRRRPRSSRSAPRRSTARPRRTAC